MESILQVTDQMERYLNIWQTPSQVQEYMALKEELVFLAKHTL